MFFNLRFWFFFPVFDIINLYISSKRFEGLIFSSNHYKQLFESMNYVCDEKLWNRLLSFSFSIFLNKLKKIRGWFGNFFIFKVSFICFSNLSLYSVFAHFCFCKRTCEKKKSRKCYFQFCSWIYPQIFDNHTTFQDIIVYERDFTPEFNRFLRTTSPFSIDVCHDHAFFMDLN